MNLCISPHGRLFVEAAPDGDEGAPKRITEAFTESPARGILHLSMAELQASLPADFSFARDFGRAYLTQLCHTPEIAGQAEFPPVSQWIVNLVKREDSNRLSHQTVRLPVKPGERGRKELFSGDR